MEHDSCPQGHHIITLTIIVGGISSVCVWGGRNGDCGDGWEWGRAILLEEGQVQGEIEHFQGENWKGVRLGKIV